MVSMIARVQIQLLDVNRPILRRNGIRTRSRHAQLASYDKSTRSMHSSRYKCLFRIILLRIM